MNELLEKYPAVLDVATVAEILGVTPATVRRLLKANVIPSVKVGRLTRVTKDKLVNTHTTKVACFQFFRNRITYLPYSS